MKAVYANVTLKTPHGLGGKSVRVPVNRAARRLDEKNKRKEINRKIAVMRAQLKVIRDKLVEDKEFEGRDDLVKLFEAGRQELNRMLGTDR